MVCFMNGKEQTGVSTVCGGVVSNSSCSYTVKINESDVAAALLLSGMRRAIPPGNQLMLYKRGLPYLSPQTT